MAHKLLTWEEKLLKKYKANKLPYLLIIFGVLLFIVGGINYYEARILSFKNVPTVSTATAHEDVPTEVIIPSLNLDIPVEPGQIKGGVWEVSTKGAVFLSTSAAPGVNGNTIIYGHNLKRIFGSLPFVSVGQRVIVKTKSGKIYNYIVDKKYFVNPDRTDLVSPTTEPVLTLYTCWGFLDSQRAVITAKPTI